MESCLSTGEPIKWDDQQSDKSLKLIRGLKLLVMELPEEKIITRRFRVEQLKTEIQVKISHA